MTMADTIAVMNHGRIEQLGSPADLYENPATTFVANFLGQSNLIPASVEGESDGVVTVSAHGQQLKVDAERCRATSGKIILGVRPEKVQLTTDRGEVPAGFNALTGGKVVDTSFIGVSTQYLVQMPSGEELSVFEQNTGRAIQRPGTEVVVYWDPSQGFGLEGSQDIEAGAEADEEAAA